MNRQGGILREVLVAAFPSFLTFIWERHRPSQELFPAKFYFALTLLLLLPLSSLNLRAESPPEETSDASLSPYQKALLNYKTSHYDEALTAIDAAEKANPHDLATEILKARILTEQGDFERGEQLLKSLLTQNGPTDAQLALGDLLLRKRDFNGASEYYEQLLMQKPGDPDLILKLIYARIGASDLVTAEKYASHLKPLDPDHPTYYFAKAAIAQATGNAATSEEDIETARTIYGITVTNRYLKTYLEVFTTPGKNPSATPSPATNAAPTGTHP